MGIPKDGLQNLANTLEGDKDLNIPRELSAEAEKELAIVEKTIREAHMDRVNPELKCILVILPSRHSPTGILMQREDVILEWIFLPRKPNKKLKTYIEKISDLIHKVFKTHTAMLHSSYVESSEGRCPSTEEWIKKMWYIYTMEYYSAEKNNDIMKSAGNWMELENIILSEVTQTQKDKQETMLISMICAAARNHVKSDLCCHQLLEVHDPCSSQLLWTMEPYTITSPTSQPKVQIWTQPDAEMQQ
ncbi:hypothetical protein STEG23_014533, partial [Scotinomys teguina]